MRPLRPLSRPLSAPLASPLATPFAGVLARPFAGVLARLLAVLVLAVSLSGCGIFGGPTGLELEFRAAPRLNPNESGEPTTVYVRIYQLRDDRAWKDANHLAIWTEEATALGDSVIGNYLEVVLDAGLTKPVALELHPEARFLGVMGLFNHTDEQGGWQQCVPVEEAEDLPFRFEEFRIVREAE